MTIKIFGQKWSVKTLPKKRFRKKFGVGLAITIPKKRKIVIRKDELNFPVIIHELTHAYFSYMCMMNVEMKHNHADEFYCDFWGDYGRKIIKTARKIRKKL